MPAPADGDSWIELTRDELPVAECTAWATQASCGAIVTFVGTVRDHEGERSGVTSIEYEAYEEQVEPRMRSIAAEARRRWPMIGRVALVHRFGPVALAEASVVVAVSTPHRREAFAAAEFCIDTLKETVPIWKREHWVGGEGWAVAAKPVREVG